MPPKADKSKKVTSGQNHNILSSLSSAQSAPLVTTTNEQNNDTETNNNLTSSTDQQTANAINLNNFNNTETKKKPGRPRKTNNGNCGEILGIVNSPLREENSMEMIYDNPILFKKIFCLLKAADVNDLTLIFARTYIRILVKEEESGNLICVNISAKFLNRYYLDEKFEQIEALVKREGFEKIFRRVNKNFNEVMFFINKEDINSIINVRLVSKSGGLTKENEIEVYQRTTETIPDFPDDFNEVLAALNDDSEWSSRNVNNGGNNRYYHGPISLEKFKVQFTLISKVFKSMIDEIHNYKNSSFEISKCGRTNEPLTISSFGMNKFKTTYTYDNPAIINLRTNLPDREDNIFSTSLFVEKVRQFTNNIIGETVDIAASSNENNIVRFISESDRRICITDTGHRCEGFVCQLIIYCFS